jgi:predicted Zn-dependent peptidase
MDCQTATLGNGLRVLFIPTSSPVVYCGYQVLAGTRDEEPADGGLAHFCEHTTFKGTAHRKAWHVLNRLESVGGDLNAFTTKETTVYHAAVLRQYASRAIELLTDIFFHSVYPQAEIDKEVEVICDEIESYNDSPADLIYDEFENLLFGGHPLGHSILGSADRVRRFTTADALRFTRRYYRPERSVFFISGQLDFSKVVRQLERLTSDFPPATPVLPLRQQATLSEAVLGHTEWCHRQTHQTHLVVGCRTFNMFDSRRPALSLLSDLLNGTSMNARLNLVLREHNGLVYDVEGGVTCYRDTGLWYVYYGCASQDLPRCQRLVRRELDRLMDEPISEHRLEAAKKQKKGLMGIASDAPESFAINMGTYFLFYNQPRRLEDDYAEIDRITPDDLWKLARSLFAKDNLTTLVFDSADAKND